MPECSDGPVHARQSLGKRAGKILSDAIDATENPAPTILWWDQGGFLEEVLHRACEELDGAAWQKAEGLPLSLRRHVPDEDDRPAVWYVPEGKDDRDWFRDVAATGAEIEKDILQLSAELYGVPRWDLASVTGTDSVDPETASILKEELTGRRRPTLDQLQEELLTGGQGHPLDRLLIADWGQEPDPAVLDQLRDQLREVGVPEVDAAEGVEALTDRARRWAVAVWLQEAGLDPSFFPDTYRADTPKAQDAYQRLRDRMQGTDAGRIEQIYLGRSWWSDVVEAVDDLTPVARCPVDGALDARLWDAWADRLKAGDFKEASALARRRVVGLEEVYGSSARTSSTFLRCWKQAFDIAELGALSERIVADLDRDDPVEVYAREEDGAWRIDAAVRRLVVAGRPETDLPDEHPGREALPSWREKMVSSRYLDHLRALAERTREVVAEGSFFTETECVTRFWSKSYHREDLAAGEEVALFFLDGLRLDLAYELADHLRETLAPDGDDAADGEGRGWSVRTSRWRATVPSETEPGMGALLPGSTTAFSVDVVKGNLRAQRNQQTLTTTQREGVLQREGWSVTRDWDKQWQAARVAFIDSDIDKGGEAEIAEIEEHLSRRVDTLAENIADRLRQGGWSKAFVVTDHGFVLLPRGASMEGLNPPEDAEAVSFRSAAPAGQGEGPGVRLEPGRPGLDYLETSVRVLLEPQQRFTKRGLSDRRYFHGGLSLQESILLFLEIEKS